VDVWAPGVNVICPVQDGEFYIYTGSSFSSPIVCGAAALLKTVADWIDPAEMTYLILEGADDISEQNPNYDNPHRINILNSIQMTGDNTDEQSEVLPDKPAILGNCPNPFNSTTRISYIIPESGKVILNIYNIMGQRVYQEDISHSTPGEYSILWDAQQESSGIYFATLKFGDYLLSRKMIFLK
jgi:hypothetical protein